MNVISVDRKVYKSEQKYEVVFDTGWKYGIYYHDGPMFTEWQWQVINPEGYYHDQYDSEAACIHAIEMMCS